MYAFIEKKEQDKKGEARKKERKIT